MYLVKVYRVKGYILFKFFFEVTVLKQELHKGFVLLDDHITNLDGVFGVTPTLAVFVNKLLFLMD